MIDKSGMMRDETLGTYPGTWDSRHWKRMKYLGTGLCSSRIFPEQGSGYTWRVTAVEVVEAVRLPTVTRQIDFCKYGKYDAKPCI
jgi:hypothetical protein